MAWSIRGFSNALAYAFSVLEVILKLRPVFLQTETASNISLRMTFDSLGLSTDPCCIVQSQNLINIPVRFLGEHLFSHSALDQDATPSVGSAVLNRTKEC